LLKGAAFRAGQGGRLEPTEVRGGLDSPAGAIAEVSAILGLFAPGAELVLNEGLALPPMQRYWLLYTAARSIALLPQAVMLDSAPQLAELQRTLRRGDAPAPAIRVQPIGVVLPPDSGAAAAAPLPVIVNRRTKTLVLPVDPGSGRIATIVKIPRGPNVVRNCRRELALLLAMAEAGSRAGPTPRTSTLGCDSFCYEFIDGVATSAIAFRQLGTFLRLLEDGEMTTPRQWAGRYAERIEAAAIRREDRDPLLRLLGQVRDATPIRRGISHGDLKPGNLVVGSDGTLRAVDWEIGSRDGLPLLDVLFHNFYGTIRNHAATSFADMFAAPGRKRLAALLAYLYPRAAPRLDDLLALFFPAFYMDRAEFLGDPEHPFIRYLGRVLHGSGPL